MISRIDSHCTREEVSPSPGPTQWCRRFRWDRHRAAPSAEGAGQGLPLSPGAGLCTHQSTRQGRDGFLVQRPFLAFLKCVQGLLSRLEFS